MMFRQGRLPNIRMKKEMYFIMASKRGTLSINSDNILPIIKKWMYSDHDIFFRELISNGCDAITKLKKLEVMGEYSFPENYKNKIQVIVNPEEKTLKFIDTGLGRSYPYRGAYDIRRSQSFWDGVNQNLIGLSCPFSYKS